MTASIKYEGDLRCSAIHLQSGSVIETDAPTDNQGKGEKFSPTDLLCVSLGTCIVTTMAIKAKSLDIDLKGTAIDVTKHMMANPRRIGQIDVAVKFLTTRSIEQNDRMTLETVGSNCPVAKSIHPDIKVHIQYQWT